LNPRDNHKSQITNHKSPARVALKVDCDTYVGTRDGATRLLEIFAAHGIRASFFFSFGPDRSGRAVARVFTQPGFLAKMVRSGGASLYGFPTVVYGTLLPAPMIGERCVESLRRVAAAGHETGVHAWDHVGWHDALDRWPAEKVREHVARAHDEYRRIFGHPAQSAAAAGWTANARSLAAEEERHLLYTSHTRVGRPFYPSAEGRVFATLDIPTTLPTLDETLARAEIGTDDEKQRRFFREAPKGTEVHTIHAEVEGRSKALLFERILGDWAERGITFMTLEDLAREALSQREKIPVRELMRRRLRGRGGQVSTGWPWEESQ
jgi:peptidoglycan/xylan/chitin deacetylase (PgdA/CDA1 family)